MENHVLAAVRDGAFGSSFILELLETVEAPQSPHYRLVEVLKNFISSITPVSLTYDSVSGLTVLSDLQLYMEIPFVLCMNRPRLRRLLCHHLYEWEEVEYQVKTMRFRRTR